MNGTRDSERKHRGARRRKKDHCRRSSTCILARLVLPYPLGLLLVPRVEEDEYIIATDTDQNERRHEIHERKDRYAVDHAVDEEAHAQRETGTDDDEQGDGNAAQVQNRNANDQNSGDQHEQHV